MEWKLTDAKNKLGELVNRVAKEGPQWITRRNDAFVVMSAREYQELTGSRRSLKEVVLNAPDFEGLEPERDQHPMRDAEL